MHLLLLLFCAAAAAQPQLPLIDEDKSGFLNYLMQMFEERRLFVNLVDTVSYDSSDEKDVLPTAVSIGLKPSEKDPEAYAFVSRNIAKRLQCVDASDAEFEQDEGEPEYVLIVEKNHTSIGKDWQNADPFDVLGQVVIAAGMSADEAWRMQLTDCWFMRVPEVMQINVAVAPEEKKIRSGWIVERYPLGTLQNTSPLLGEPHYLYPVYLTNYTYIDRDSGKFVDVQESRGEDGSRVWTPTGWPVYAKVAPFYETPSIGEDGNFTRFRETETGVLITTHSQIMRVTYNIEEEATEERIELHHGHHFFVSCNIKEGTAKRNLLTIEDSRLQNITTNNGVEIELQSGDRIDRFMCPPKRATPSGAPELLQLDFIEQSGSRDIPWSDREITVRRINVVKEETTTTAMLPDGIEEFEERERQDNNTTDEELLKELMEFKEQRKEEEDLLIIGTVILRPQQPQVVEVDKAVEDEDEKFLTRLALMVLAAALLALGCVICAAACIRRRVRSRDPLHRAWADERREEQARKRKEGSAVLRQQSLKKLEEINKKHEEEEARKLSTSSCPARSNSTKKITFAPKPAGMRTDDLVKMINEEEIGSKIDAMVEAGPDGEEDLKGYGDKILNIVAPPHGEEEVQQAQPENPTPEAAVAASPVGEGTPVDPAPVAERRAGVEADEMDAPPLVTAAQEAPIPAARTGAPIALAEVVDETSKAG